MKYIYIPFTILVDIVHQYISRIKSISYRTSIVPGIILIKQVVAV